MNEAGAFSASAPSESLSWHEICRTYPDQWVALVEIDWDDEDEVRAAPVAGHGRVVWIPSSRLAICTRATRRSVISSPDASARRTSAASRCLSRI